MTPDDFMAAKAKSKEDSITDCVWLRKGFTMLVAAGLIYQAVKWLVS